MHPLDLDLSLVTIPCGHARAAAPGACGDRRVPSVHGLRGAVAPGRLLPGLRPGHSFDIAGQGYVNAGSAGGARHTGDSPAMVAARSQFLGRGHYPAALRRRCDRWLRCTIPVRPAWSPTCFMRHCSYYLAAVLDALPHRHGVCDDLSVPALRRAARAHPRAAARGAHVWQRVPLADQAAALALGVFGPRNAAETNRVLAPGGTAIVAAPNTPHLARAARATGHDGPSTSARSKTARGLFP